WVVAPAVVGSNPITHPIRKIKGGADSRLPSFFTSGTIPKKHLESAFHTYPRSLGGTRARQRDARFRGLEEWIFRRTQKNIAIFSGNYHS
ncbi:MAG: hypothetical protein DRH12_12645, partial [Deltaproteobacteria bacterium]